MTIDGGFTMDLDNPWALFSGIVLGIIGTALFVYGKKQSNLRLVLAGGALFVVPAVVSSILLMWLISGACVAGATLLPRGE
jgi:hypothetical protein